METKPKKTGSYKTNLKELKELFTLLKEEKVVSFKQDGLEIIFAPQAMNELPKPEPIQVVEPEKLERIVNIDTNERLASQEREIINEGYTDDDLYYSVK